MKTTGRIGPQTKKLTVIIALLISSIFLFAFKPLPRTEFNLVRKSDLFNGFRRRPESSIEDQQAKLNNFISEVENGNSWQVVGIFVESKLEISVVFQPDTDPGFVSRLENTATLFGMAEDYGTLGMLAHNYLAGANFFELETGDQVYVIYGDGNYDQYNISEIKDYQALSPYSPYSNFIDLESDGLLSAENLFYSIYEGDGELVFQTCIEKDGIDSWGRHFVIAEPIL